MSHPYGYTEKYCLFREILSLQYAIRLAANPSNPAFEVTFPPQFQEYYERKPNAIIKSCGFRIAPFLESANINTKNIQKHSFSGNPSWSITKLTILFDIHNSKKSLSASNNYNHDFQIINTSTLAARKLKIRLAVRIYRAATMKRSVFRMAHIFSLLNPRLWHK